MGLQDIFHRLSAYRDRIFLNLAVRALLARRHRRRPQEPGPGPVIWTPDPAYLRSVLDRLDGWFPRECPLCGYRGYFRAHGLPPRFDARCPDCGSFERHRLMALWLAGNRGKIDGRRVLHFAPEPALRRLFQPLASQYLSADAAPGRADRQLDITAIDLPAASFDVVLCSHVLEHVDDARALEQLRRVLSPNGILLLLTPVVDAWSQTYENPSVGSEPDRWLHFGQGDHVRYYGRDIVQRIAKAGFDVARCVAAEPEVSRYGLVRGETIYVATVTTAPPGGGHKPPAHSG
jgi:SAM-dependent methyltransferase